MGTTNKFFHSLKGLFGNLPNQTIVVSGLDIYIERKLMGSKPTKPRDNLVCEYAKACRDVTR